MRWYLHGLLLLVMLSAAVPLHAAQSEEMLTLPATDSTLVGYGYRKAHGISAAAEAGTGYQVQITTYAGHVDSSAGVVGLEGHARADFADVRFAASDGVTPLSYWMEEEVDGDHATSWVKIPDDLSAADATIYVYYGNALATSASNGSDTFTFFDDFSGDLSKWTASGGTWTIQNGQLKAEVPSFGSLLRANGVTIGNNAMHAKVQWVSGTFFQVGLAARGVPGDEPNNSYVAYLTPYTVVPRHLISKRQNGLTMDIAGQGTTPPSTGVWYDLVFQVYGSNLESSAAPLYPLMVGGDSTFGSGSFCLFDWSAAPETVLFDDVYVRKYVEPEPAQGAWGTEEALPLPLPPVADFTAAPTSGPAPLAVAFTDQSTGAPVQWSWNFGDGGAAATQDPMHTYTAAGSYTVSLTATNEGGSNTATKPDYISVSPAPSGGIAGQVTDGGATPSPPVSGAAVACAGRSTTTDVNGNYLLTGVPVGVQTVTVTAPFFQTATVAGVSVADGQTTTLNVALTPLLGSLRGTVRDAATQQPIANASVTCQGKSAQTNSLGVYALDGLRASVGNSVTASAPSYTSGAVTGVTIGAGAATTRDLTLAPAQTGSISGVVTDVATGAPISGATVNVWAASAVTDANGAYSLQGIGAGTHRVGARAPGHTWASDAAVIVIGGENTVANFALAPLPGGVPRFTAITGLPVASGVAWGDYDGDGYPDVFVTGSRGVPTDFALLHNERNLTFKDVSGAVGLPAGNGVYYGAAWGDYNNDGRLDLFTAGDAGAPDRLFRNDGTLFTDVASTSGFIPEGPGRSVAWCDYDRDNWLDLFVCYIAWPPNHIVGQLYHNNRDGTFTDVTAQAGFSGSAEPLYADSLAWGDYDNDGWPDLAMTRYNLPPKLYHNNGDGTFTEVTTAAGLDSNNDFATGVAWADYDNDGWLDLYMGGSAGDRLYHNNHDGTFTNVSATAGIATKDSLALAWADYDGDGYLDVYARANEDSSSPGVLYHATGGGAFANVAAAAGVPAIGTAYCAAWADADRDGRPDLWIGGDAGSTLLHNTGAAGNWLRVRALTDRNGDAAFSTGGGLRDAIGARVEVNVDDDPTFPPYRTLTRLIDGGSGAMAQNEPIAQFGVPTAGPVAVRVLFPNGSISVHRDVPLDQQITIKDARPDRVSAFDDVPLDYWAYSQIVACVNAGIVAGYPDRTYRPLDPVTRDQMAVYVSRALAGGDAKVPTDYATASFPDVPTDYWAFKYVEYARSQNIVTGYPDGTYQPTNPVSRGQMAVYIARCLVEPHGEEGLANWIPPVSPHFTDVPTDDWAYKYVEYVKAAGVVTGYPDGTYRPDDVVTRDQMAVYVARAFGLEQPAGAALFRHRACAPRARATRVG